MNLRQPERRDALAAAYVLGTLRGRARERFERAMLRDPELREAVHGWEYRLGSLVWRVRPERPPARLWRRVHARISPRRRPGGTWLPWTTAAASTAAAVALAVALVTSRGVSEPDYLAIIGDAGTQWALTASREAGVMRVSTVRTPTVEPDQDLELWLLPGEEAAPVSLGVLPESGRIRRALPAEAELREDQAYGLAVSVEPTGGSPTGQPTGAIVLQGRLVPL